MIENVQKAVDLLGGPSKMSRKVGCSRQAIYLWLNGEAQISPEFVLKIEEKTNGAIRREMLRPDLYPAPYSAVA